MHQTRSFGKTGAGLPIFIHDSLTCCIRQDLNINNHDSEALCIETINNKGKKKFSLALNTNSQLESIINVRHLKEIF